MIDGITVLYQKEITQNVAWVRTAMWIICVAAILCMLGVFLIQNYDVLQAICGLGLIICILAAVTIDSFAPKVPTGKYEYKVTIDDTVPMTEFYEKFKVIDQEGEIWTIRDK